MKIEPDDFAAWKANPITQAMSRALRNMAGEAEAAWHSRSWVGGSCDERELIDLRATARVASDLAELTLEELEAKLATSEA